ncbi:MAG: DEAD/DEAH box helicase family protein [Candidatus Latescibacterota bacterium]
MNEAETRAEHIDPALKAAGWGVVEGSRILREYSITPGRIEGLGRRAKPLIADYILNYRNTKLAVVEAKAWDQTLTEGVAQAKNYATKLAIQFTYATNGQGIYGINMETGKEGEIPVYPTPEQLWAATFPSAGSGSAGSELAELWRDRFAGVPFEDKGGSHPSRYYQDIAVERVLAAIATGQSRILLTLATGTGKTFIAFQIAWKLFHSRWNLTDWRKGAEQTRRPRILFLADRNILANQAFNAFSAFAEDALVRIAPEDIRKKGKVPTNGSLFFTIFQTFMASAGSATGDLATGDLATTTSVSDLPEVAEPDEKSGGYMYILGCSDDSFYTGSTTDLHLRLEQHRIGEGAQHTKARLPVKLLYYEPFDRIDEAFAREKQVQGWGRAKRAALIRGDISKLRQLAQNRSVPEPVEGYFGEYPPDFFDFIVIDECHRGGANDESNWRGIMDYFAPAVQLGLTATPKRRDNVDTYRYFGEPVFIYSLQDGINDGFLTPFKVRQISTTLDEYVYTPDDRVMEGEVVYGKIYQETDFNKIIEIKEREAHRVKVFMDEIDQREKTLVFCATQDHALAVRDLTNLMKTSKDPNYCQRVTANDGALGEQHLRDFQDNEKTIPTILTTSQKLSTGVDARNIRNIVLMRPINSMIEFKQIIGRGTRLYDGKDYFTIYDFVKAHHHFSDPEWDGEPIEPEPEEPCAICGQLPCVCEEPPPQPCPVCGQQPCVCPKEPCPVCGKQPCVCGKRVRTKVKLADGKERTIQHMMCTSFWHPDGTLMSAAQFMELLFGKLPEFFRDEEELRTIWSAPDTRKRLLEGLTEKGFGREQLAEMQKIIDAEKSDLFDVLAHVAYAVPPVTREVRAASARIYINTHFGAKQQTFLDFVLQHYVSIGVEELDQEKLKPLLRLRYHDSIADAVADLGRPEDIGAIFAGFQRFLYQRAVA